MHFTITSPTPLQHNSLQYLVQYLIGKLEVGTLTEVTMQYVYVFIVEFPPPPTHKKPWRWHGTPALALQMFQHIETKIMAIKE